MSGGGTSRKAGRQGRTGDNKWKISRGSESPLKLGGGTSGEGLVRPEVSVIKFLQGGRARGESWSGDLRRQWRDPEPNRPAVRCGDSMKSWT